MFNLGYFRRLAASSRALRLNRGDQCRFLWSYYGSRFPGAASRRYSVQEIVVRNQSRPLRLAIRTNGSDLDVMDEIFARGAYDFGLTEVKTVLDLGGNIGMASAFFHTAFPDAALACVEPVPANIKMIGRNIELNRLPVKVFEAAVGPENGTAQFRISLDDFAGGSASYTGPASYDHMEVITVKMMSVPAILDELGWDRVDLLKLDIEGGERELLAGNPGWLQRVGAIIGEGHKGFHGNYTVEDIAEQLRPAGFRVKLLEQRQGAFVFAAAADPARIEKLPGTLTTGLVPMRGSGSYT
jgi:FkbM family methyltransferase